ncbi:hypothetical protein AGMMS50212_06670 [Spirochaetia bacterium]|nr:hypothetical protein AGMMS50212_06670 [Spirochaetia bacterium]
MKKTCIILAVLLTASFAISCKTIGGGASGDYDRAFNQVYGRYKTGLNLDGAKTYTVVSGDTLVKITRSQYGADNGFYFPVIMLASSETVADPDKIAPGMKLTVPSLDKNLNDPLARLNIKTFLKDVANVYKDKGDSKTEQGLKDLSASL